MAGIIRIPGEAFGTQRLRAPPSGFKPTPRTTDADFGADIGRAPTAARDALGESELDEAVRRNEAAARDIDNRFAAELRTALHDPEGGYFAMRGRASVDARDPTHQAVSNLFDRHVAMAANPAQQQMTRAVLDRRLALARVEGYVSAGEVETDWQRYYELQDLALQSPGTFAHVNLIEEKPDIASRDLDELEELQEVIRKGDPDNDLIRLRMAKEMVDDTVNSTGVAPSDPAAVDLRRRLEDALVAFADNKRRGHDPDDMRRVLASVAIEPRSAGTALASDSDADAPSGPAQLREGPRETDRELLNEAVSDQEAAPGQSLTETNDQEAQNRGPRRPPRQPVPKPTPEMEREAKKYGLNANSATTQQIVGNLDMPLTGFISKYREGRIMREIPSGFLDGKATVRDALQDGAVRKLLIDGRFAK